MFRLQTCFKIRSEATHEVWVVPDCFLQEDEEGTKWLQLRFSVAGLCKLFTETFRHPLSHSAGVQLLLKKRNDAVSALQGAAKDKSIFDDSDEETAGPNPEQQLEAGAMFVKLSEDTTVILQIPKRKDSEVRIKLEEANIQALFSWLSEQDLTPQKPPEKPTKSKAQKRKGAPMDKKAAEVSPDS